MIVGCWTRGGSVRATGTRTARAPADTPPPPDERRPGRLLRRSAVLSLQGWQPRALPDQRLRAPSLRRRTTRWQPQLHPACRRTWLHPCANDLAPETLTPASRSLVAAGRGKVQSTGAGSLRRTRFFQAPV